MPQNTRMKAESDNYGMRIMKGGASLTHYPTESSPLPVFHLIHCRYEHVISSLTISVSLFIIKICFCLSSCI
uniref:Uncharacterized protein n=1 Tax=Scylla paramamosain TaxID=85552 RepID=D2DT17_SCYPA|nr:hypothetical protein [Scylla paramamosain]